MKKYLALYNVFVRSVLAGAMIGFGCIVYLMCPNRIVGAFLFSFGLLTIVCRGLSLYTGKVGYCRTFGALDLAVTLAGNFVGTFLTARLFAQTRHTCDIASVVEPKLADDPLGFVLLSAACGAMMFLAVDSYRKSNAWLFVILPVVIFILSGFEHSIANMFYLSYAGPWTLDALRVTAIAVAGNAVGSWLIDAANFTLPRGGAAEGR